MGSTTDYILIRTNPTTSCAVADVYKLDISSDVVVAIPKAFTPNADNLNDVLKIELGAGLTSLVRFTIFNRWGKTVFSSQSVNEGWDGKTNGVPQEMDAYTYFIEYINYKNERFKKTGSVVLLR
jgi:gliding motility-associated-like protein